jgi:site-specific recombinase XerD
MNGKINKDLKEIAKIVKIDAELTTYVARHSYATIMKISGISTTIISQALGHDSEKTTQIYLDSFENSILDEASKAIL